MSRRVVYEEHWSGWVCIALYEQDDDAGNLDDFSVVNRALSGAEVSANYAEEAAK